MRKTHFHAGIAALSIVLAACGPEGSQAKATQAESASATSASGTMKDRSEMAGGGTAERMQGHMQMMRGASGERMKAMLPEHRQMAANMIAGFNQEMKGMNMPTNAAWNATVDSLRQDLVRMPDMPPGELQVFMPAHEARLNRLVDSHRTMMGNMKM